MARLFGGLYPLRDADVDNDSPALAELARGIVGNIAYAWELATGRPAGDEPVSPPNPQGELGVDLSGPPWGPAILHPIAAIGGGGTDAGTVHGQRIIGYADDDSGVHVRWRVWVRPHARIPNAPYSRAYPRVRASSASASGTLYLRMYADDDATTMVKETSVALSATAATNYDLPGYIDLVPGWNDLRFRFLSSSPRLTIISLSLNVSAKRAH